MERRCLPTSSWAACSKNQELRGQSQTRRLEQAEVSTSPVCLPKWHLLARQPRPGLARFVAAQMELTTWSPGSWTWRLTSLDSSGRCLRRSPHPSSRCPKHRQCPIPRVHGPPGKNPSPCFRRSGRQRSPSDLS